LVPAQELFSLAELHFIITGEESSKNVYTPPIYNSVKEKHETIHNRFSTCAAYKTTAQVDRTSGIFVP